MITIKVETLQWFEDNTRCGSEDVTLGTQFFLYLLPEKKGVNQFGFRDDMFRIWVRDWSKDIKKRGSIGVGAHSHLSYVGDWGIKRISWVQNCEASLSNMMSLFYIKQAKIIIQTDRRLSIPRLIYIRRGCSGERRLRATNLLMLMKQG